MHADNIEVMRENTIEVCFRTLPDVDELGPLKVGAMYDTLTFDVSKGLEVPLVTTGMVEVEHNSPPQPDVAGDAVEPLDAMVAAIRVLLDGEVIFGTGRGVQPLLISNHEVGCGSKAVRQWSPCTSEVLFLSAHADGLPFGTTVTSTVDVEVEEMVVPKSSVDKIADENALEMAATLTVSDVLLTAEDAPAVVEVVLVVASPQFTHTPSTEIDAEFGISILLGVSIR
jgi:hypothetical protein